MWRILGIIRVQTTALPGFSGTSKLTNVVLARIVVQRFTTIQGSEISHIGQEFPEGLEPTSFLSRSCMFVVHVNV